jgi:GTP-binding protein
MAQKSYSRLVAIVGRPNVGKSSLFNKLIKKRKSLVFDVPGVTRDRLFGTVEHNGEKFFVCDTGGFETSKEDLMQTKLTKQSLMAIDEAHLIIFVVDGTEETILPADRALLKYIRKAKKEVILCVNKIDNYKRHELVHHFHALGIPDMFPVSAEHSLGLDDLLDKVMEKLHVICPKKIDDFDDEIRLALIGRPNVGKSSILNKILGEERSIVDKTPGTTRDVVDALVTYHEKHFRVLDTAGIRKKSRVSDKLESFSSMRSMSCIEEAHVTVLVIDAEEGVTEGDARVAGYAFERHKPILIVINKWDLILDKSSNTINEYTKKVLIDLKYVSYAKIIFVSALENQRVSRILPICLELYEQSKSRKSTSEVNTILKELLVDVTPPMTKNKAKRIKFFYATQVGVLPPTFIIFCSHPDELHFSYKRYLENSFRERLGLKNIPLNLVFKQNSEKQQAEG